MRIIVVGAGIGGLTTAIALSRLGIDVQVFEQATALREVGAGIGLMANALSALDVLGLGDAVRSQSVTGVQGGLRRANGDVLLSVPANAPGSRFASIAVMHRAELLALLAQRVDSSCLHLGRKCIGVEEDSDGVTASFDGGEVVCGDGLIGTDGLRSIVRSRLFGDLPLRYAGYTAWRGVVETGSERDSILGETWGSGCRFGIVPMSHGRVYWFATKNAPEGERDPRGKIRDTLARLFRGWHQPIEALIAASQEESILRNDIYDIDPLPHFARGRIGLLGDAAHAMTPNLGQGGCQAIEDAVVLGACLKTNAEVPSALIEYEKRRMPRTRKIVIQSRRFGSLAQLESGPLRLIRDAAIRATPASFAVRQTESLLNFEILSPSERALYK
ncbi:MAG TPA: FAD-dependent monooxygenase [Bryobacteraceae bacterium]|nr:FAD-dependent monooxygenase [Bryobacteraceae bacterium]